MEISLSAPALAHLSRASTGRAVHRSEIPAPALGELRVHGLVEPYGHSYRITPAGAALTAEVLGLPEKRYASVQGL